MYILLTQFQQKKTLDDFNPLNQSEYAEDINHKRRNFD
jgi:hypothetical protein